MPKQKRKFLASDLVKTFQKDFDCEVKTLASDPINVETDCLDTGSDMLNALISGSTVGGIPIGKMTGLYGPSGCGKTFIVAKAVADGQKKGFIPIVIDTEATWDSRASAFGVDVTNCVVIQEDVIEVLKNKLVNKIAELSEVLESGDLKLMIILDSIGGLSCQKEVTDIEKGKDTTDMGTRAKSLRTFLKAMIKPCDKYNIPFIWTNHCYDNPAALTRSAIQNMPGGKAPWFYSSIIVMMRKNALKDVSKGKDSIFRNKGSIIPIECVKQRYVRPDIKGKMYIDYDHGLHRYYGLFEVAKELGVIEGNRTYRLVNGDDESKWIKLGYQKDILNDYALWKDTIIPILDPIIRKEFSFGSSNVAPEIAIDLEELENEFFDEE